MVGKDLIMATLFGSGGGSSGSGGGEGEKSLLDALIDRSITEISSDTVESVGQYAFARATKLQSANFPCAETIGSYAFERCYDLVSVNIPAAKIIDSNAFSKCTAIDKIVLHNVTSVTSGSFFDCKSLKVLDFHQNITFPSAYVFGSSSSEYVPLNALVLRANTPCTLKGTPFFNSTSIASGTGYIYVPADLVDTYKAATNWSKYADQFRALEDYTVDGTITGELDESKI